MAKFHINPETGNAGACKAVNGKCPFGSEDEHFATKREAQAVFEKKQEVFEHFNWKSNIPPIGSTTLATYDPMSEDIAVSEMWGNKVFGAFGEKMDEAKDGTRLVIENGQVLQKDFFSGSWKFVAGDKDVLNSLERGESYDRAYLGTPIMQYGARLENGGATPRMAPEHRAHIVPDKEELQYEAGIVSTEFTKEDGGYAAQDLESRLDDYVTERWHELTPTQWSDIGANLRKELGEPTNLGTDEDPSWIWKKNIKREAN